MQENRTTMLSSSETYHLGSTSNNPTMDQHNLLPDDLERESYPHYSVNGRDTEIPNGNIIGQQNANLDLWSSGGSSSMGCLANEGGFVDATTENFGPSLSVRGSLSIEGTRHESTSSLPQQNLNIDLNLNQVDQSDAENGYIVQNNEQSGMDVFPLNGSLFPSEHVPSHDSLDAIGSSSQTANFFDRASAQQVDVIAGRHSSCKRKTMDGIPVESSSSGSSSTFHQNKYHLLPSSSTCERATSLTTPTSSNHTVPYPLAEQLNQSIDINPSPVLSDHYSFFSDPHGTERYLRNTRMRINPNECDVPLPNLLPEGGFGHSVYQPTQQQSSSFIPVQPRVLNSSTSSHNRPHVPTVTQFSQNLHRAPSNGNLGSRIGSSSGSTDVAGQRYTSQDLNRSLMTGNYTEPLLFGSTINASQISQDSTNLHLPSGSRSTPPNSSSAFRGAVNVGTQQMLGLNTSQQSSSMRGPADVARRSLLSAGVSHSRSTSMALQHRGHSSMSHETRNHQPGSSSRAHQQPYLRAVPLSIERQNASYLDLQSFMQSIAASREGSRTVSELRNVVDQIRQGRNARLEDLLLIDRSLILRRGNFVDRHRDMRLDVDNMSYEELLALGERIGYVSTGLSEDKIMNGLKQWKFVCIAPESPTGVEPCCICQEDYTEGEDMGRLDCGHDFHTACIKQWLVIKNLCPICKKTALGT